MIYLLSLSVFVWLLRYADERTGLQYHNHKNYLIIAGSAVALMMGLRTQYTGSTDTYVYMNLFKEMAVYKDFETFYKLNLSDTKFIFSETGFHLLVWYLTEAFDDAQILVFVTSVFITFSTCYFIYKNTSDVPLGLLIYVCFGLFTFNMNGMRQAMAMSVCLFAYEFVKKRKLIPFILVVLLGMQFHRTAICFMAIYILPTLKKGKINTFLYLCGMVVFMLTMDWFIETFNSFSGKEYEVENQADSGGISVVLIYMMSMALAFLAYAKLEDREVQSQFFCVVLGFVCYISRYFSNIIMERVSYYFFYFTILLIPNLIEHLDKKEGQIVKILLCAGAILLFWYRLNTGTLRTFRPFFVR